MKILLLSFFTLLLSYAYGTNTIAGSINQQNGTIQVLIRNSPFDDNVTLISESNIKNGAFNTSFEIPNDAEIILSVNDLTVSKQIESGSDWTIELEIVDLPKPDFFGNEQRLEIVNLTSTSITESKIFEIEKNYRSILDQNRKKNGKIGNAFIEELENYLNNEIEQLDSKDLDFRLGTSQILAYSLASIRREKGNGGKIETFFIDNFQPSFSGIEAVNNVYAQEIQLEFLSKQLGKSNYFEFIDIETAKIDSKEIQQATLAVLITSAVGRKWTNQDETITQLSELIENCLSPDLKSWLEDFREYHSNSLIGEEVRDFEMNSPNGDQIQFSDYRGKYLLIDFWATWCGPCIKNMKKLPALKNEYQELEVLCVTTEVDVDRVRKFIDRNEYETQLNFGIAKNDKELSSYFNKRAIPLYFLIDPNGIIIDKAVTDPTSIIEKHLRTK